MLLQLFARLMGVSAQEAAGTGRARLAPLLALWAALPTRRLTRRTRDQEESARAAAAEAATLRALRRLVACIGWIIHGRRNRGMRPAARPLGPTCAIREARPPPSPLAAG